MTIIYINDSLVDLQPNTVIPLSLKTVEIGNISSRYANRTTNIKLPKTNNNKVIFGNADFINSASRIPYTSNTARIIINGVEVVNNGKVFLNSTDEYFNITIYWGIYGLAASLTDLYLKDLTNANADSAVIASPLMMSGSGGVYFLGLPTSDFPTVIESILTQAGFTYSGDVFSANDYQRMALVYGRDGNELNENFALEKEFTAINTGDSVSPGGGYDKFSYDTVPYSGALGMYLTGTWATDNATAYAFGFTLRANINVTVSGGTGTVRLSFLRDGSEVGTPIDIATGNTVDRQVMEYTATHAAGVNYDYVLGYKHLSGSGATITVTEITYKAIITRTWLSIVTIGSSDVQNRYMLPDIKQLDLIKEFMKFFALVPHESHNSITFKSINAVINDRANAVDWSSKRVRDYQEIDFSSTYSQNNYFTYDSFDKDSLGLANYTAVIDSLNLPEEKDLIESMFSDSKMEYREWSTDNWVNMALIPSYTGSDIVDAGLRIVMIRSPYSFESTSGQDIAYFIEPREDYDMSWEYFYNTYYSDLFNSLQDIKVVKHKYNLTEADIQKFNPSLLVYDNGVYYAFPEIINFVSGKPTIVKMLKV